MKDNSKAEETQVATDDNGALSPLDRRRRDQLARDMRAMSFSEARDAARQTGTGLVNAADAGIGYKLIEHADDKDFLVGVELMVLPGWTVNPSEKMKGKFFTSAYIKTAVPVPQLEGGTEFILNDGSSGIAQQLAELRERCIQQDIPDPSIYCKKGLKKSEYEVTDIKIDEATGEPVMDRRTNKPVRVPRLDPVTGQPVGRGATYYLDTAS